MSSVDIAKELARLYTLEGVEVSNLRDHADAIHSFCKENGIPPKPLLDAAFTKRYTEILLRQVPRIEQIPTKWGTDKLLDYLKAGQSSTNPIAFEKEWVKRYIPHEGLYVGVVPRCLILMRQRQIPFLWLIQQDEFIDLVYSLPKDTKEEFFGAVNIKDVITKLKGVL